MRMVASGGSHLSVNETTRSAKGLPPSSTHAPKINTSGSYHAINDHSYLHHALPSLDDAWRTTRWPIYLFNFSLTLAETNLYLVLEYVAFVRAKAKLLPKFLSFHQRLVPDFIDNPYLPKHPEERVAQLFTQLVDHKIQNALLHGPIYANQKWVWDMKSKYLQLTCTVPRIRKSYPILGEWIVTNLAEIWWKSWHWHCWGAALCGSMAGRGIFDMLLCK